MDDAGNQIGTTASVKNGADAENLSVDDKTGDETTLRNIQDTAEITVKSDEKSGKTDGRIKPKKRTQIDIYRFIENRPL